MSLRTWLQSVDNPTHLLLPKARGNSCFVSANKEVVAIAAQGKKKKRGRYHHYDAKNYVKISKYAFENGNSSAARKLFLQVVCMLEEVREAMELGVAINDIKFDLRATVVLQPYLMKQAL